jgi:hypothetical protein
MYLSAASSITLQPTFQQPGFFAALRPVAADAVVLHPDYNGFIPAKDTRRLNDILKMAITCSIDALRQAELEQPDAIVVGTSMGCNHFTKQFLDKIVASNGGLIAPTSFMLSTHNTIAGQISLFLGNRNHNTTHTQDSLSFEHALIDAALCLRESGGHVLVGAADEMENDLYNMHARIDLGDVPVTCGASFFVLSAEKSHDAAVRLYPVGSFGLTADPMAETQRFLNDTHIRGTDVDLVLYAATTPGMPDALRALFPGARCVDVLPLSGAYYTFSAFALHAAMDALWHGAHTVLVWNNLLPENLGCLLISR